MAFTPRILLVLLLPVAMFTASCKMVGSAAYIVGGLPKVDAEHALANQPTVVFVDDRHNAIPLSSRSVRRTIADKVSQELMTNKVLAPERTIDPRDAISLVAAKDRHSDLMPIDAIGRGVGAKQIVYVEMLAFSETPDGATPRPTAMCRVRVIDVDNRQRLYPPPASQEASRALRVMLEEIDPTLLRSQSSRLKVHMSLAELTGEHIAKLFYKHVPRELGRRLEPK